MKLCVNNERSEVAIGRNLFESRGGINEADIGYSAYFLLSVPKLGVSPTIIKNSPQILLILRAIPRFRLRIPVPLGFR